MTKPVTGIVQFQNKPSTANLSDLDANISALQNATNDLTTYGNYFADNGGVNAYNLPSVANLTYVLANATGTPIKWKPANSNSGASTLNVFGTGAIAIVSQSGGALTGGEIIAGRIVETVYDGTSHQLSSTPPISTSTVGSPGVTNSRSKNNAGSPTTQWDMTADLVVMRNPSNNTLVVNGSPGTKTVDITVSNAPGGRDQTGAFTASTWIYFYWIGQANGTTSVVASATAPTTGPNLAGGAFSGYVYWQLDSCQRLTAGTLLNTMYTFGNAVVWQAKNALLSAGGATTETALTTTLNTLIPPIAQMYKISGSGSVTGGAGISTTGIFNLYVASTVIYSSPDQVADPVQTGGQATSDGMSVSEILPNTGYLAYRWTSLNGSASANLSVPYFTIANGG